MTPVEERLRAALKDAMRARDRVATSALRSALGALGNATAVPGVPVDPTAGSEHVAGAAAGLGAAEVPRRELTAADAEAVVRAEIADRLATADQVPASADRLRAEAAVLTALLADEPAG